MICKRRPRSEITEFYLIDLIAANSLTSMRVTNTAGSWQVNRA
jgi:hypothetical protein